MVVDRLAARAEQAACEADILQGDKLDQTRDGNLDLGKIELWQQRRGG